MKNSTHPLPHKPGAYLLLLRLPAPSQFTAGRLGTFSLQTGWYAYTGSALGPGGIKARVSRHLRAEKKPHWHIDALTAIAPIVEVWVLPTSRRLECTWTALLRDLPGTQAPAPGFGASDCTCESHLLHLSDPAAAKATLRGYFGDILTCTGNLPADSA